MSRIAIVAYAVLIASVVAFAADWPEWRGPERNGVVEKGPPLVTTFPATGPKRLWLSEEEILSGDIGGYRGGGFGAAAVADGRAYCSYVAPRPVKIEPRTLTEQRLINLGWSKVKPPEDLRNKVEQARESAERQTLKDPRQLAAWIKTWCETNFDTPTRRAHGAFMNDRLRRGAAALDLALLDKLESIKDKPFPNQEALDAWFAENKVEGDLRKTLQAQFPDSETHRDTIVICMDAATGKTVWKKTCIGGLFLPAYENAAASGTPTIVNGKVYLLGTNVEAFCLDAKTGEKIWSKRIGNGKTRDCHCSFIVADGAAVVSAQPLIGLDAETGRELWSHELKEGWASPVYWRTDGHTYFVVRAGGKVLCVDPKPGTILWSMNDITTDGLFYGMTPVVEGDRLVLGGKNQVRAYRLSRDKAEELWKVDCPTNNCCSPTIYEGHVYVFAATAGATCINLQTGKVAWQDKELKTGLYNSPLVADGRFFLQGNNKTPEGWCGDGSLFMVTVSPEKAKGLSVAKIGQVLCTSAAMVDGRLFCRLNKRIACYDLRAQQD